MRRTFIIALSLVALSSGCSRRVFHATSSSMFPTIRSNENVVADMTAYRKAGPRRWDVVVFHPPVSTGVPEQFWVMRVVGLPGESLEIRDEGIFINGKREVQPGLAAGVRYVPGVSLPSHPVVTWPYKISVGCYFVVGDNSTNALDSRFWGELSGQRILGKVEKK